MKHLHIDIETFSEADIQEVGAIRYAYDPTTIILMVGYAVDGGPVIQIDVAEIDRYRKYGSAARVEEEKWDVFVGLLKDHDVVKVAHNAAFERSVFNAKGLYTPVNEWKCSMVAAGYAGWPLKLADISKAMQLENGKLDTGTALIKLFSCPCKPTRINHYTRRNLPSCYPEKWEKYKEYNKYDVLAEREIWERLEKQGHLPTDTVWEEYHMDQTINDRGVFIDAPFANKAIELEAAFRKEADDPDDIGVNLRSVPAMKKFIFDKTGISVSSLNKDNMPDVIESLADFPDVVDVLRRRNSVAKTSTSKYPTMLAASCDDGRVKGTFQFYGASRTGRWAGRLLQLQNLPQNHIDNLDGARAAVMTGDPSIVDLIYGHPMNVLSQLIRTAITAPDGKTLCVADYSAIEARVTAWLAGEDWVLDVFRKGGDIYCSTASKMFDVPVVNHGVNGHLRPKGKVATLALGYGGGVAALERMGGSKMGLTSLEMEEIKTKWRKANPNIVRLWGAVETAARGALSTGTDRTVQSPYNPEARLTFRYDGESLSVVLPGGRSLHYVNPMIVEGRITYQGMNQVTKQWTRVDTYGGKLTENLVQAVSRDLLAHSIRNISLDDDFSIVAHVHDEIIAEVDESRKDEMLGKMIGLMCDAPKWADGLPLNAAGFTNKYYRKD